MPVHDLDVELCEYPAKQLLHLFGNPFSHVKQGRIQFL